MARHRALAAIFVTIASVIAVAVGGMMWLVGVAFMGICFVILVASL